MKPKTKVAVMGIWHTGSVYSACLADLGYGVVGWDRDGKKVAVLNRGILPLFEPGLGELMAQNTRAGNLTYTTHLPDAVKDAPYVVMTFDTPVDAQDEVDLAEVWEASRELSSHLEPSSILIMSSQVPVGTCEQIRVTIKERNPGLDFDIAYVPENLRLGQAIEAFKRPERVVIGADNPATLDRVEEFLSVIKAPKVRMDLRGAEMVKHALNAFLGMSISFINEIANLCDGAGADALQVAAALRLDERVGPKAPLHPGLGFAGGTLARDLKALQKLGDRLGYETHLVDAILRVNQEQNRMVVKKLERVYGTVKGLNIGILGLTYKPGTSTLRRSAALEIIQELVGKGAQLKAYDPQASQEEIRGHSEFQFCADPYEAARESDALVLITDWPQFKELDFDRVKAQMRRPLLLDARNMLNSQEMTQKGFHYWGIGRGSR